MGTYVDGFLLPIPRENIEAYRRIAEVAGAVWKEHGALAYRECVADDLEHEDMVVSFLEAAGAEEGETVVFAWIVYESREARDRINEAVMNDPRLNELMDGESEPFDYRRMAYGGFKTLVEA